MSDANSYLTVDNLLLKLAEAYLSGAELALFTTMINSLKEAKNQGAVTLFDSSSKSFSKANFQLGVAAYVYVSFAEPSCFLTLLSSSNTAGNAMFKIGAYYYGAEQNIDRVLFFTFGSQKVEFYAGMCAMVVRLDPSMLMTPHRQPDHAAQQRGLQSGPEGSFAEAGRER